MCLACRKIFEAVAPETCPHCGASVPHATFSENTDTVINEHLPIIHEERKKHGIEELARGLDCVVINTEPKRHRPAVEELLRYTGYTLDGAFEESDSITSVTRLSPDDFALVFTSGISPFVDDEQSGPTEQFIQNYGSSTHHLAFFTEKIEWTFGALKKDGLEILSPLLGSPEEGLKQTFSTASEHTLIVTEYIYRCEGFDGFFTRSNVTELTRVTENQ